MDVLSDVLDTVRLTSTVVVQTRLTAPWGMRTEPRDSFAFHVVSGGTAWFAADGSDPVALAAGDVVVLAPGHGHTLRSHPMRMGMRALQPSTLTFGTSNGMLLQPMPISHGIG